MGKIMKEIKVEKLLPCPFCGGKAELITIDDSMLMDLFPSGKCVKCTNNDCWVDGCVIDYKAWQLFERC